ncbi:protein SRC2-like [Aristolochia californica]|uniref:protein SRC2-like n=1 Tax=Aristolochia californica TaxID=171875 RepID=UPI0035DC4AB9
MPPMEVEVRIRSAKDLKNVNWRNGDLKPYAVVWVHPDAKCSTKVDLAGDTSPTSDETLTIPLRGLPIEDATLAIDIVHVCAADDTKPLVGSARLPLRDVLDDVGLGERCFRTLKLKRPSGRPQGKLDIEVTVREERYYEPPPLRAGYGFYSRDYAPPPVGYPYGAPPALAQSPYAPPPVGYPYGAPSTPAQSPYAPPVGYSYNPAPAPYAYGNSEYGRPEEGKKGSKFGMGTGLAVGAVAGALGGLALAEGVSALEDKIADDAAERVEDDLAYDDYGGGDF